MSTKMRLDSLLPKLERQKNQKHSPAVESRLSKIKLFARTFLESMGHGNPTFSRESALATLISFDVSDNEVRVHTAVASPPVLNHQQPQVILEHLRTFSRLHPGLFTIWLRQGAELGERVSSGICHSPDGEFTLVLALNARAQVLPLGGSLIDEFLLLAATVGEPLNEGPALQSLRNLWERTLIEKFPDLAPALTTPAFVEGLVAFALEFCAPWVNEALHQQRSLETNTAALIEAAGVFKERAKTERAGQVKSLQASLERQKILYDGVRRRASELERELTALKKQKDSSSQASPCDANSLWKILATVRDSESSRPTGAA